MALSQEAVVKDLGHQIQEDFLQCQICLEHYQQPKILPCLHTFCRRCLQTYMAFQGSSNEFHCPGCKTLTAIPPGGVDDFKNNFIIQNLMETVSKALPKKTPRNCDSCKDERSCFYCEDCEENLCKICADAHKRVKVTRSHILKGLPEDDKPQQNIIISDPPAKMYMNAGEQDRDEKPICQSHAGQHISCFCLNCSTPMCALCLVEVLGKRNRDFHHNHTITSLDDALSQFQMEIVDSCAKLDDKRKQLNILGESLISIEEKLNTAYRVVKSEIQQHKNDLISTVEAWAKCADKQADFELNEQMVSVLESNTQVNKALGLIDECQSFVDVSSRWRPTELPRFAIDLAGFREKVAELTSTAGCIQQPFVYPMRLVENNDKNFLQGTIEKDIRALLGRMKIRTGDESDISNDTESSISPSDDTTRQKVSPYIDTTIPAMLVTADTHDKSGVEGASASVKTSARARRTRRKHSVNPPQNVLDAFKEYENDVSNVNKSNTLSTYCDLQYSKSGRDVVPSQGEITRTDHHQSVPRATSWLDVLSTVMLKLNETLPAATSADLQFQVVSSYQISALDLGCADECDITGLCIGVNGELFLVESTTCKILHYSIDDKYKYIMYQRRIGQKKDSSQNIFKDPQEVAKLPNGLLAVADGVEGHGIKVIDIKSGKLVANLAHGFLKNPVSVACLPDGKTLVVADNEDERLLGLSISGQKATIEFEIDTYLDRKQFKNPWHLASSRSGNIAVSDNGHCFVKVFSSDGTFLFRYGQKGKSSKKLLNVRGVCFDFSGRLYIMDVGNDRIHVLNTEGHLICHIPTGCIYGAGDTRPNLLQMIDDSHLILANSDGLLKIVKRQF